MLCLSRSFSPAGIPGCSHANFPTANIPIDIRRGASHHHFALVTARTRCAVLNGSLRFWRCDTLARSQHVGLPVYQWTLPLYQLLCSNGAQALNSAWIHIGRQSFPRSGYGMWFEPRWSQTFCFTWSLWSEYCNHNNIPGHMCSQYAPFRPTGLIQGDSKGPRRRRLDKRPTAREAG